MKSAKVFLVVSLLFLVTSEVRAEEINFPTVWKSILGKSHAQMAAQLESDAGQEAKNRSAHHWLPRIYLDVKGYQTNDPGSSFIGLLEQRAVAPTDFTPDAINHPDQHTYIRGALGIDLPLYEGGMKSAEYRMQKHLSIAKEIEMIKVRNDQYSEVARTFGSIAVLDEQKNKLSEMSQTLEHLLKSYKLGIKSNPVGYSGLLGLKSLANRIQGLLKQYEAQSEALNIALKEMGLEAAPGWKPEFKDVLMFGQKFLTSRNYAESASAESIKEKALAAKEATGMEKSRYLPRVGAFAESYTFNGNRATSDGYTAGLYLQWNLFNPADYGTLRESKLHAAAADNYAQSISEKERVEYQMLFRSTESLKVNIGLLNDSQKIMEEQTQVTESLFKNGSVNALQFVEVLARRVDLIAAQTELHLGLLKNESEKILKTQFIIPLDAGGKTL